MSLTTNQPLSAADLASLKNRIQSLYNKNSGYCTPSLSTSDSRFTNSNGTKIRLKQYLTSLPDNWQSAPRSFSFSALTMPRINDIAIPTIAQVLWAFIDNYVNQVPNVSYSTISGTAAGNSSASNKSYYEEYLLTGTPIKPILGVLSSQISKLEAVEACQCYCYCYCYTNPNCDCGDCSDCCGDMGCPGIHSFYSDKEDLEE